MSLARAVISGTVYRNPEKRYTGNNIPVCSFALNIDEKETSLIRVTARGNNAETASQSITKGCRIAAEGRLQITSIQAEDGTEKKVMEIDLSSFEILSSSGAPVKGSAGAVSGGQEKKIVEFAEMDMADTLIDEEEIPF